MEKAQHLLWETMGFYEIWNGCRDSAYIYRTTLILELL